MIFVKCDKTLIKKIVGSTNRIRFLKKCKIQLHLLILVHDVINGRERES